MPDMEKPLALRLWGTPLSRMYFRSFSHLSASWWKQVTFRIPTETSLQWGSACARDARR